MDSGYRARRWGVERTHSWCHRRLFGRCNRGNPTGLTRVFPGRESVEAAGAVGLPRVGRGQVRRERLSAAV